MTAGLASPVVDPKPSVGCESIGGAAEAAVCGDAVIREVRDIRAQELAGGGHKSGKFGVGERTNQAERMNARSEADFRFEDVADAGEQRLRHQRSADFEFGTGAQTGDGLGSVELRRKQRRAEGV